MQQKIMDCPTCEDLGARIENLLFVIWIQDQRHDFYMKFIREVEAELEALRRELK